MNKRKVINLLLIILGNLSLAISTSLFILPHSIVNGGTSGISIITDALFGFNPELVILILCWSLFVVGWIFLGKQFALKTLVSTILYPILVNILGNVDYLTSVTSQVSDTLLATITGAILAGFGLGVCYRAGASTGGLDVVCLMLKKYFNIKVSLSTLAIDASIIILGLISVSFENALYGLLCVILTAFIIEKIMISGTRSYMAHIVSDKSDLINDYLNKVLERGTTLIEAKGGLTGNKKTMIEVVFNEKEYYDIKKNIYEIDNKAFISVYKSINAYGEGFDEIFIRRN